MHDLALRAISVTAPGNMPRSTSRFIAGPIRARRSRDIPATTSALGPSAARIATAGQASMAAAMADRTSRLLDRIVMRILLTSGVRAPAGGQRTTPGQEGQCFSAQF
jgi:hypothetical protein